MLSCASFNKLIYPSAADVSAVASGKSSTVAVDGGVGAGSGGGVNPVGIGSLASLQALPSGTLAGSGAPSETQSEISSVDSDWSDIRAIALKLGVQNPDDLHTERFKVDRQKLEQLIKADSAIEGMNGAEYFFHDIMNTTDTYVSWPCRLKIGAKSKKDPHVRIVGKVEQVQRAKERILSSLDSRGTRVIMKMDVSYTDHSYIIGRGGNNIKRIMDDTHTHIHFPDSNRSNPTEKSNQVSLCGSLEGVERARALVRLSTPLLISFEMPVMGPSKQQPDHDTPYIKMIESKFNVQVIFSTRPKLHTSLVLVKGSEKESAQVRDATQLLINFACESIASQILVNVQMEISPQHHEIVKGKNNVNLLSIMERTQTKIIFPDLSDMNVKPLKKSQVTISGRIDDVYKARQQLLGNLPVALIFDFPDNQNDASEIMSLNTKYGVYITLRQKQRQSTLAIVVKGVEKFIDKIYEARQEILRLATPAIKPEVPDHYFMPKDKDLNLAYRTQLTALLAGYVDSPKTPSLLPPALAGQLTPYANNNHLLLNANSAVGGLATPTGICAPTQKYMQLHNSAFQHQQLQGQGQVQGPGQGRPGPVPNHNNNYLQVPGTANAGAGVGAGAGMLKPPPPPSSGVGGGMNVSPRNSCSQNTSGYQSFSSSTTSLEQSYPPYAQLQGAVSSTSSTGCGSRAHYSPDSTYSSEAGSIGGAARLGRRLSDGVLLGLGNSGGGGAHLLPGSAESYRSLHYDLAGGGGGAKHHHQHATHRAFDFDMKRALGFKAMERTPVAGELRTPTPAWMGMGLSCTSPAPIETVDDNGAAGGGQGWRMPPPPPGLSSPYGLSATTGLLDATPVNRRMQLSQHKDIQTLLTSLGLEHYIKIFVLNEIDLEMFTTLTEENLMELGITAFGARKKLLAAIHTLLANEAACSSMPSSSSSQNSTSPRFSGSAAPGAERRPSNQW
ncbi:protein bicaudal C [Drosophila persimilis]|uniref:protein bicaudal C n=1 Tax=Drosophila persimilis TaxID=7234 RepID=UPI000F075DF6|nr:protein bicaudal C [Drosophila persimilis]